MKNLIIGLIIMIMLITAGCTRISKPTGGLGPSYQHLKSGTGWVAGFAQVALVPPNKDLSTYFVAGYKNDNRATGLLDYQTVNAFWLDDCSGRGGVVFVSVDCVGLARSCVQKIRASLTDFVQETGCRAIHVISTHTHAGIDTMGLWGPVGIDGKDKEFMALLRESVASAVKSAYAQRKEGTLLYGYINAAELQYDSRNPQVFDPRLSVFRFAPEDGSAGIRFVNFAAHPESLRGDNSKISADFPAYLGRTIQASTGDRILFAPGAIGGLIMTPRLKDEAGKEYPVEINVVKTGELLAAKVLAINNERVLDPSMNLAMEEFYVPLENPLFLMMHFLGILSSETKKGGPLGLMIKTEVSYMELGDQKLLLIPGELFPELAYEGDDGAFDVNPGIKNPPLLSEIVGDKGVVIFGMANDEIGYIVPPSNFLLDEEAPYIGKEQDVFGENHYEETNSLGPETARLLAEAVQRVVKKVR